MLVDVLASPSKMPRHRYPVVVSHASSSLDADPATRDDAARPPPINAMQTLMNHRHLQDTDPVLQSLKGIDFYTIALRYYRCAVATIAASNQTRYIKTVFNYVDIMPASEEDKKSIAESILILRKPQPIAEDIVPWRTECITAAKKLQLLLTTYVKAEEDRLGITASKLADKKSGRSLPKSSSAITALETRISAINQAKKKINTGNDGGGTKRKLEEISEATL